MDNAEQVWHPYEEELPPNFGDGARNLEWTMVKIRRGDLARLDKMITLFDTMASLFSPDFYDDLWNMRNTMIPFQPDDEHYDVEINK